MGQGQGLAKTFDRIMQDPNVLAGRATIRGLRSGRNPPSARLTYALSRGCRRLAQNRRVLETARPRSGARPDPGPSRAADAGVVARARTDSSVVLTFDLDFGDVLAGWQQGVVANGGGVHTKGRTSWITGATSGSSALTGDSPRACATSVSRRFGSRASSSGPGRGNRSPAGLTENVNISSASSSVAQGFSLAA